MLLSPRDFVRFLDGRYGDVQRIAFVPGDLSRQIGTLESNLLIERTYARKLLLKHRLRYEHFQMIQPTIERGYVVIDGGGNLVFAYDDQERFHARFRLAVKTTDARDELWLRTFHRIKLAQMNSLVRRFRLIREHQTREHMEPE
jgi:hypothetical protein